MSEEKKFPKDEDVFIDYEGEELCVEETCLEILLRDDCLVLFDFGEGDGKTVGLAVNCSDVFAWACADFERFLIKDISPLYKAHRANPRWGSLIWCCIKRNQKPQPPIIKDMKKDGVWTDELETLPDNWMDAETQAMFAQVSKSKSIGIDDE